MPSYVTTIKADVQRCKPDPCGGQALQDAQQLSARHVDSLRHEIFHQTKARVKGLSQGKSTPHLTHTHQRKILLGFVGPLKAK